MSLKDKKSLYDRNTYGVEGNTVGNNLPGDGTYFTDKGNIDSPFVSKENDHMKTLLVNSVRSTNSVTSTGTPLTYLPSPNQSDFQDLDGVDGGQGYFHGIANPGRFQGKQLGGQDLHRELLTKSYTYNHGPSSAVVGPSPGPSGFSDFQDLPGDPRTTSPSGYKNPDTGAGF